MKKKIIVFVSLSLLLHFVDADCPSNSLSSWVRATGNWLSEKGGVDWSATEPAGLMVLDTSSCVYKTDPITLTAGKSYEWKVTTQNSWDENYGCSGRDGPNCVVTVGSSGVIKFTFNYANKVLTVENVGGGSTPTSAPSTTAPTSPPASGSGKQVFAHFMMGNAYGYDQNHFQSDMSLAKSVGIDAFAMNIGQDSWSNDRLTLAYNAAANIGFKLFLSFDMNYWSTESSISNQILAYCKKTAQYKYNNKIFVSTFGGSWVNMEHGSPDASWNAIKTTSANGGCPIFFVPNFAVDPNTIFSSYPNIDGAFSWGAWPDPNSLPTGDSIFATKASQAGKVYMAPWSPSFYTHLSYKNYLYDVDGLWYNRWQQLLSINPQMIEIITWNDWGEAHYIGPIDSNQGDWPSGSAPYVQDFTHQAWLDTLPYFIGYYKNGAPPAVNQDIVVYWYRPHLKDSQASGDPYGRPSVYYQNMQNTGQTPGQVLEDKVFVITILRSAGTIQVTSGSVTTSANVPAGAYLYSTQMYTGTQKVTLLRNNAQLCTSTGAIGVVNNPTAYNYNVYVGECKY